jgi:uncharacterized delta-60 repeat protein
MMSRLRPVSRLAALGLAALGTCDIASAQSVDIGFNPGANQVVVTLAVQADRKILVGGEFTGLGAGTGATTRNHIGRLNGDGTVDPTFNPGANAAVNAVAVQTDGKILVGGFFTSLGNGTGLQTSRSHIGRLNADGTVDLSFNPGANGNVWALAVQPDGKILVGGEFSLMGGGGTGTTPRSRLARLNPDGSLDTFNPGASKPPNASAIVYTMALQSDGEVVVGGDFTRLGGGTGTATRNFIGRINADGTLDPGFSPGATSVVHALAIQADGNIVVGGSFIGLGGGDGSISSRQNIGRLGSDGSVDLAFNPGTEADVLTLALQVDGKILAGGLFKWMGAAGNFATRSTRNRIGRLNPDGTVDLGFDPGADNTVNAVVVEPDGFVLAGGVFGHLGGGSGLATLRSSIGRINNTDVAFDGLDLGTSQTGGGPLVTVLSWVRTGSVGPEVQGVTFEWSTDFVFGGTPTFAPLGIGTRVSGVSGFQGLCTDPARPSVPFSSCWQLPQVDGQNLPFDEAMLIRVRASYGAGYQNGSGSVLESLFTVGGNRPAPQMFLDKIALVFSAINSGAAFTAQTSAQTVRLTQLGASSAFGEPGVRPVTWTATSTAPWLVVSPTSGSGSATLPIYTQFVPGPTASETGDINRTFAGA